MTFLTKKEKIFLSKIKINRQIEKMISEKFLLVYTNQQRFAHSISKSQKKIYPVQ